MTLGDQSSSRKLLPISLRCFRPTCGGTVETRERGLFWDISLYADVVFGKVTFGAMEGSVIDNA